MVGSDCFGGSKSTTGSLHGAFARVCSRNWPLPALVKVMGVSQFSGAGFVLSPTSKLYFACPCLLGPSPPGCNQTRPQMYCSQPTNQQGKWIFGDQVWWEEKAPKAIRTPTGFLGKNHS